MQSQNLIAKPHGKGGRCALTPAEEAEVLRLIASKVSKTKIASDMGVHRNTVKNIEDRHKETRSPHETAGLTDAADQPR